MKSLRQRLKFFAISSSRSPAAGASPLQPQMKRSRQ
jgi:hypothetical protein